MYLALCCLVLESDDSVLMASMRCACSQGIDPGKAAVDVLELNLQDMSGWLI